MSVIKFKSCKFGGHEARFHVNERQYILLGMIQGVLCGKPKLIIFPRLGIEKEYVKKGIDSITELVDLTVKMLPFNIDGFERFVEDVDRVCRSAYNVPLEFKQRNRTAPDNLDLLNYYLDGKAAEDTV